MPSSVPRRARSTASRPAAAARHGRQPSAAANRAYRQTDPGHWAAAASPAAGHPAESRPQALPLQALRRPTCRQRVSHRQAPLLTAGHQPLHHPGQPDPGTSTPLRTRLLACLPSGLMPSTVLTAQTTKHWTRSGPAPVRSAARACRPPGPSAPRRAPAPYPDTGQPVADSGPAGACPPASPARTSRWPAPPAAPQWKSSGPARRPHPPPP